MKAYHERGVGVHFAHLRPGQVKAFGIAGITDIVSSILTPNIYSFV